MSVLRLKKISEYIMYRTLYPANNKTILNVMWPSLFLCFCLCTHCTVDCSLQHSDIQLQPFHAQHTSLAKQNFDHQGIFYVYCLHIAHN
jgi:hypothetical protein